LKLLEAGRSVEEMARECGVSKHTMYGWESKYVGMGVGEEQETKQLRAENARIEEAGSRTKSGQGHATSFDARKLSGLVGKRAEIPRLVEEFQMSVCGPMEIPQTGYRYHWRRDDPALRGRLLPLAREKPRLSHQRFSVLLYPDQQRNPVNHKRLWRAYRDAGLHLRSTRRKGLKGMRRPRPVFTAPNQEWAVDFASDVGASGRRLGIFSLVDTRTRECLGLEVDIFLLSRRVARTLADIIDRRGPGGRSRHFLAWCIERRIDATHIQPRKPTQNAHAENFHGRLHDQCLSVNWLWSRFDARCIIETWPREYDFERPRSALKYLTLGQFARRAASPPFARSHTPASGSRLPFQPHRRSCSGSALTKAGRVKRVSHESEAAG
jgi:putative transposase